MTKDFIDCINEINEIALLWKTVEKPTPERVLKGRQKLTGLLVYLENQRAYYHDEYEKIIFNRKEGVSVNAAQNEAHVKVPQLYLLRRVMEAAYEMSQAMASYVSYMKLERQHES